MSRHSISICLCCLLLICSSGGGVMHITFIALLPLTPFALYCSVLEHYVYFFLLHVQAGAILLIVLLHAILIYCDITDRFPLLIYSRLSTHCSHTPDSVFPSHTCTHQLRVAWPPLTVVQFIAYLFAHTPPPPPPPHPHQAHLVESLGHRRWWVGGGRLCGVGGDCDYCS